MSILSVDQISPIGSGTTIKDAWKAKLIADKPSE